MFQLRLVPKSGHEDGKSSVKIAEESTGSEPAGEPTLPGFDILQGSSTVGSSMVRTTTSTATTSTFSREYVEEHMIQLLNSQEFGEHGVTIICLVGSSGIGKTTLIHRVYKNPKISENFDTMIWVCMPENIKKERLMKEIIESVTHLSCSLTQISLLQEVVQEELMGKKFFLVLDDALNQDRTIWTYLVAILSVGAKGSSVVISTNNRAVCEATGANHFYSLPPLSDEACWSIFADRAFNSPGPVIDSGLIKVCKKLVSRCEGNTFCVKALSGLIHYAIQENQINDIVESDLWNELGGKVSPVLNVCYSFLPLHLKQCFVYLSLFPKNHVFSKLDIVRLWMSQGFIGSIEGMQPEDSGILYLDELFHRSFLQHPDFIDAQEDKVVIMHELTYELARSISPEEFFRSEGHFHGLPQNVKHFSLVPSIYQKVQLKDEKLTDLQSVLVIGTTSVQKNNMIPRLLNFVDLDHLFLKAQYIRALDLYNTDLEELPSSIGLLERLHYLGLNNTKIKSLPSEICSIKTLQTLEVKDCTQLAELPQNLKDLVNLRHLNTRKLLGNDVIMPNGMGQLTNLHTLIAFSAGANSLQCRIEELKNLKNLRYLHITGIENIKNGTDAKEADLQSKSYLKTLELEWCEHGNNKDASIAEEVLECLEPNRNLQELILRNYLGIHLPMWIDDPRFSNLGSIILDSCFDCDKFPAFGQLPSLRCLSVRRMNGIQRLWANGRNFGEGNFKKFPSLEVLNLCEMYELEYLFELQDGDFPFLHTLSISNCPMLKTIPQFPFLVELSVRCCVQLPHIQELPSLEFLKIQEFHNIKSLNLPQVSRVLKRLEISHCNNLSSVEGLSHLTSLEKLKLFKCPKLDSLNNWQPHQRETVSCSYEKQMAEIDIYRDSSTRSTDSYHETIHVEPILSTDLNPSIDLGNTIEEWSQSQRNEAVWFDVARRTLNISSSEIDVLHALDYVIEICEMNRARKNFVMRGELVPSISDMLKSGSRKVRLKALQTLRIVAEKDDDNKEDIAAGDTIQTIVKFLSHEHSDEREEAACLLDELSKRGTLCEKIGEVSGLIAILVGTCSSKSGNILIVERAERILENLGRCEGNVKLLAENGRLQPLLRLLLQGSAEIQLSMAAYLSELVLSNDLKVFVAQTAGSALVDLMRSGNEAAQESTLTVLNQISSYETSAKILIKTSILPPLVRKLFMMGADQLPTRLKEVSSTILTNLVCNGMDFESTPIDQDFQTLVSEEFVHNLLHMISNARPAIQCNLLQVLVELTSGSTTVLQIVTAIKSVGPSISLIQFVGAPQRDVRMASIKLLSNISPYMGQELADSFCAAVSQLRSLINVIAENNEIFVEQVAAAGLLADLLERDSVLTRCLLEDGSFDIIVSKVRMIREGETRGSRFVTLFLEGLVRVLLRVTYVINENDFIAVARELNLPMLFTDLLQMNGLDKVQVASATALENLSRQSKYLSRIIEPPEPGCFCFGKTTKNLVRNCKIHRGICSFRDTFCLLEGNVVEKLITCLDHINAQVVEAGLAALCTLLEDGVDINEGVMVLLDSGGIKPILEVLCENRTEVLAEKSVWAVERILRREEIAYEISMDQNVGTALVEAFRHGNHNTRQIAEQALKRVEKLPKYSDIFSKITT